MAHNPRAPDWDSELVPTRDLGAVEGAGRAMVYLTVQWSMQERFSRIVFKEARGELVSLSDRGVEVFVLEEDDPAAREWLAARGWSRSPAGVGSVLWLERGRVVASELN